MSKLLQIRDDRGRKLTLHTLEDGAPKPDLPDGWSFEPADDTPLWQPTPDAISDRQFAQALALAGTITEAEALAWAARGELPQAMEDALEQIPNTDGLRFGARMMLAAATSYERRLPLTEQLGALLGYDAAALDALWSRAAAL
ncbi:hypothetical protein [Methylorubrum extorquens]|uniref:hypothetical protein n=1 Tax=Methylorubrum extorquens TaxID=408 RepID=UPI002238642D|nr:hypothetical protein [Methylorubrum extorquens]UYW30374.1 hypothetical protein OKB92_15315 [Methylorubrum extorquens]